MTHWQCRQLHSIASQHANQRILQQWRVLLLRMHGSSPSPPPPPPPPARHFASTARSSGARRAFSSCSCRADKRSSAQAVEATMSDAFHSMPESKRAAKRRIPIHLASKIDKLVLSPQAISSAMTILSHLEANEHDRAWEAFERLPRDGKASPGPHTVLQQLLASLRTDIRADSKNRQKTVHTRRLNALLSYVRSTQLLLDENEFRVVLELLDRLDQPERAEVMLRTMQAYCSQPATERTYNKLAAAYLRRIKGGNGQGQRYMGKLETLLRTLEQQDIAPDVVTFNILLSARGQMGQLKDVEAVFCDMERLGITPNDRTLNIALDIYGKANEDSTKLESRLSRLAASLQPGCAPDVITYATTIRNAVLQRDMAGAERTLKAMVGKGILPNEYVYTHLVLGYVETGDMEKAHMVIRLMHKAPNALQPTAHLYGPLIQAYARSHEYKKAYQVLSEMMDQGIPANLTTYTILASMFVNSPIHDEPSKAIHILRSLWKLSDHDEPLDQASLTLLIEAHGIAGSRDLDWDAAWALPQPGDNEQHTLSRRKLHALAVQQSYDAIAQPDYVAFTTLLTAYARLKMPEKAWHFWSTLTAERADLNSFHYNALIMGLVDSAEWYPKASQVFQQMLDHGVTPDIATFDLMIHGAYSAGDLEAVQRLWRMDERPRPAEHDSSADATATDSSTPPPAPVPLVRTYYYALHAMLAAKDDQGAHDVFREFRSLPLSSLPASTTLWAHLIHKLYRVPQ